MQFESDRSSLYIVCIRTISISTPFCYMALWSSKPDKMSPYLGTTYLGDVKEAKKKKKSS